ncbi:hypothetical protein [Azospirillum argentinense]
MADSDDSTALPTLSHPALGPGFVRLPVRTDSPGLRDLDVLTAPLAHWDRVPEAGAVRAMAAAKERLQRLEPRCLGDAVALLMTVTVAGGDCTPPETVAMITRSVAFLTADAPHLRRPELEHLVLAYAMHMHR